MTKDRNVAKRTTEANKKRKKYKFQTEKFVSYYRSSNGKNVADLNVKQARQQ